MKTATAFVEFFSQQQHQLLIWGIGDVSQVDTPNTDSIIIPMQLSQLKNIAKQSKGRLVTMSHDKSDLYLINRYIKKQPSYS